MKKTHIAGVVAVGLFVFMAQPLMAESCTMAGDPVFVQPDQRNPEIVSQFRRLKKEREANLSKDISSGWEAGRVVKAVRVLETADAP